MIEAPSPYAGTRPIASLGDSMGGVVTLVEGRTFALSGRTGDMSADLSHGLFMLDTRVLSRWEMRVNGHRLEPLAVHLAESYTATFATRGQAAAGRADADLVVFRLRHVGRGMREQIIVTNYGAESAAVVLEAFCDADFADLFEVKERRLRTSVHRDVHVETNALRFVQRDRPADKQIVIRVSELANIEPGLIVWRATLAAGETWRICVEFSAMVRGSEVEPRFRCQGDDSVAIPTTRMARWRATVPDAEADNEALAVSLQRSGEDLGALRIFDPEQPDLPVVAAGAPWFMTVFGRDSLITGWMSLLADPSLAHGVLHTLARFQGEDVNDSTEEEPGRILHEMRFSEAGGFALDRGDIYYGSIDSTPLFVMLLAELRRWDPNDEVVDELLPHADRALAWIEEFGDRDGDGYVEYERRTERGLANQGWKDSWDAIRHPDGALATAPIALCEVQGYVYAAYVARAHLAYESGDTVTHDRYVGRARELRRRFNEDFWLDEHGTYALALDADKKPVAALASNPGHCLWTGIVDPERAPLVAAQLLHDGLFSGWGVRTLSSTMTAYNPVSYHNGSVWPHDNAICAAGLSRYGLVDAAHRVITAQLDVAAAQGGRLPELFAGFPRSELPIPAAYPASCSPQAWAAASPLLWLRTILRLDPWAPQNQIWLDPRLPPGINRLHVSGVRIGQKRITIHVEGDDLEVDGAEGFSVITAPRHPVSGLFR